MAEKSTLSILLYSGSYSDVLELLRTVWLYPAPHPIALGIIFESKGSREPKQLIAQHSDPSIIAGDSLGCGKNGCGMTKYIPSTLHQALNFSVLPVSNSILSELVYLSKQSLIISMHRIVQFWSISWLCSRSALTSDTCHLSNEDMIRNRSRNSY